MKNKFFITLFACLLPWMAGAQQIISKQNNVAEKDYIAYLFTYFTGNHISEEKWKFMKDWHRKKQKVLPY